MISSRTKVYKIDNTYDLLEHSSRINWQVIKRLKGVSEQRRGYWLQLW